MKIRIFFLAILATAFNNNSMAMQTPNILTEEEKKDQEILDNKLAKTYLWDQIEELLLTTKADINVQGQFGRTVLMKAVIDYSPKSQKIIDILLSRDADVNKQDSDGNTALIHAVDNNNLDMVKLLVEKKANVNQRGKYSKRPLAYAQEKKNKDIIKFLTDRGAE